MAQAAAKNIQPVHGLAPTAVPDLDPPARVPGARGAAARDAVLKSAIRLFCRQGITATGIDAIVAHSGVARATLYKHFGSKDALVAAALEAEGAAWRAWFFARMAQREGSARERLLAIFDVLGEWFRRDDYFGCALMNAAAEHRNQNSAVQSVTRPHKQPVIEYIQGLCAGAGAKDAKLLAAQIDLIMDGAIIKALVTRSAQPSKEARAIAAALLDASLIQETV